MLDRVAETRESVVITKRGRPVARLVPVEPVKRQSLLGSVEELSDIVAPLGIAWDAES